MALIQCTDCHSDISDAAAACPRCGAPVPVTLKQGQEQCPWCMSVVDAQASICPGCRARKGYATNAYGVMGKGSVIAFGLVLPLLITAAFPPAGLLLVPVALFCAWRLKRGPVWYQTTRVGG
ncbi:zinc ribbon domain-containing protein [Dyella lutea]|uniref:Zinc ribbon domain-containing protein n=1 Tax=Dyella lutea TaxID=2950441 RepID=A0ABT1FER3_9GAMM|nr:zinc ribbon domain-containing protein [Dyella lutea]MCP1375877.1 zinc ribbon domain-containing protein [Dyella lutea]